MMPPNNASTCASTTTLARNRPLRTVWLDLLNQRSLQSPDSANMTYTPISGPLEVGKDLEDIVAHVFVENAQAEVNFFVGIKVSFDGVTFQGFTNGAPEEILLVESNPNGYFISPVFTDRSKLGRFIRFELGLSDNGNGPYMGIFSVSVALRFAGQ